MSKLLGSLCIMFLAPAACAIGTTTNSFAPEPIVLTFHVTDRTTGDTLDSAYIRIDRYFDLFPRGSYGTRFDGTMIDGTFRYTSYLHGRYIIRIGKPGYIQEKVELNARTISQDFSVQLKKEGVFRKGTIRRFPNRG